MVAKVATVAVARRRRMTASVRTAAETGQTRVALTMPITHQRQFLVPNVGADPP
jgi:hypothetical protein